MMSSPATGQPRLESSETPQQDSHLQRPEPMTLRIPKWTIPVIVAAVVAAGTWMSHLTIALGEVQQTQARGEYLFESHDEIRADVRQQTKEISEIRQILVRIEARMESLLR